MRCHPWISQLVTFSYSIIHCRKTFNQNLFLHFMSCVHEIVLWMKNYVECVCFNSETNKDR